MEARRKNIPIISRGKMLQSLKACSVYQACKLKNCMRSEKEIAELKTDVKYIREDVNIMQKQIRDLNKHTNMGLGGIRVLLIIGAVVGAIWTVMKIMGGKW